jgi:hypothetical protein
MSVSFMYQSQRFFAFGALAKLRKVITGFVMSLSLSVRPSRTEQLGSHWTDIREIWYLSIFRKCVEKIQVS